MEFIEKEIDIGCVNEYGIELITTLMNFPGK